MTNDIHKHMDIIGADGVSIGKVDHADKHFILLIAPTEGAYKSHVHKISRGLVAGIEGKTVRLSANADVALTFEEEA